MADVSQGYITQEILDDVCDHIKDGKAVIRFPFADYEKTQRSFFAWLDTHATDAQLQQYTRAMEEDRPLKLFEEMLEIADDDSLDIGFTDDGKPFVKGENIQRARLKVDTRKWMIGKMNPKKYSDKTTIAGDPENPLQHDHTIEIVHVKP